MLVVSGDAGTGKSRLLEECARRARERGMAVASARGSALSGAVPYDAAVQLLATLRAGDELLGDLADAAGRAGADPEPALLHRVRLAVLETARRGPVALVVDRADLIDPVSARILEYVADRIDDLAALVVVSMRREARAGEPGPRLLENPRSESLHLGPLDHDGIRALMGAWGFRRVRENVLEELAALTAGFPALLAELLGELTRRRLPATREALAEVTSAPLPGVTRAVATALKAADRRERRLARAVLVLGDAASPPLVARMVKAGPGELLDGTERLAVAGILARDPVTDGPALALRSPLVAGALADAISAKTMTETRLAAAEALRAAGADPETVARHLLDARPGGRDDVVEVLHEAARVGLATGRPADAVPFLARALAEPPRDSPAAEVEVDLRAAETLLRRPGAIDAHAAAVGRLADAEARVAAMERLGDALFAAGDRAAAAAAFDRALHHLPPGRRAGDARARLTARYAAAAMEIPGLGRRARDRIIDQTRDRASINPPLAVRLAMQRAMAGAPASSVCDLARWALESGLLYSDDLDAIDAKPVLVQVIGWCEEFDDVEEVARAVLDRLDPGDASAALVAAHLAASRLERGLVRSAATQARAALAAACRTPAGTAIPVAAGVLVAALLETGDTAGAAGAVQEARAAAVGTAGSYHLAAAEGWVALAQGNAEDALDRFRAAHRLASEAGFINPTLVGAEYGAISALARLRRTEEARETAAAVLSRARSFGAPRAVAAALRVSARAAPFEEALSMLDEALDVLDSSPAVLERARCLTARGATLRRLNRRGDARECLRLALDAAHRIGASRLAARAHAELIATGARPRRRYVAGWDSLTPAETRVAELAARGFSNREIADALFLTVKTVEWHLRNVFSKLGISSRRQIAVALRREEVPVAEPAPAPDVTGALSALRRG